jgi:hypothetical protein
MYVQNGKAQILFCFKVFLRPLKVADGGWAKQWFAAIL